MTAPLVVPVVKLEVLAIVLNVPPKSENLFVVLVLVPLFAAPFLLGCLCHILLAPNAVVAVDPLLGASAAVLTVISGGWFSPGEPDG